MLSSDAPYSPYHPEGRSDEKSKLHHIIPTDGGNFIDSFVSKHLSYCSITITTCINPTISLCWMFLANGNLQSQPLPETSLWIQIVPPLLSLGLATYSDALTHGMKRKPLVIICVYGVLVCHLLRLLGGNNNSTLWTLIHGLSEVFHCGWFTLVNAMRVDRLIQDGDGKLFGYCQIMLYLGWFLTTLGGGFWSYWSTTLVFLLVTAFLCLGPLQDYVLEDDKEHSKKHAKITLECNDEEDKADDTQQIQALGWNLFDWLQTKLTLKCIILTLVLNTTLVCVQTMNVLDGLMEDWFIFDQWLYAFSSLVAVGVYYCCYGQGSKHWMWTITSCIVIILILTGCGYISSGWLRYGTNAIGTSASVAWIQVTLIDMWLLTLPPNLVATAWWCLDALRRMVSPVMGHELFFVTTFSSSYYWIAYVCFGIFPLLVTAWWWKSDTKSESTTNEANDGYVASNEDSQQPNDMREQEANTTGLHEYNYDSNLLIGVTLAVVFYFALVQVYWIYGYPNTTSEGDDDDYYHSMYFWSDWSLYLQWTVFI